MKVLILGSGMQGRVVAQELARFGNDITVIDIDRKKLSQLKISGIKKLQFDIQDKKKLIELMSNFDLVVGALPARFGFYSMECALYAGVDMVDMSYSEIDPFLLDKDAKKSRLKIVPDAGFAPGLSNILVGETVSEMKGIENLKIMVGGIPKDPIPPFNYSITWSVQDLIEEYERPARIRKNFKTIKVPALSGTEEFFIPGVGRLECFYTDGLRTLLKTIPEIKNMEEKTIRYPGHARIFKTLIDCGFFSDEKIRMDKNEITCRDFTLNFLKDKLSTGRAYDLTILLIELKGRNSIRKYRCIDYYDRENHITSMARMTAYTCVMIARCIKEYPGFGVIAQEYLGMEPKIACFIKNELKKKDIRIVKREIPIP